MGRRVVAEGKERCGMASFCPRPFASIALENAGDSG